MVKALTEQGVAAEGFEKGSDIGGLWRYENDSGTSSAYRSLHIDSSRRSIGFTDFPVPEGRPDYLSHEQVLGWLEDYAGRFDLRRHFRFRTEVIEATPAAGGTTHADAAWLVRTGDGQTRPYRALLVANGHLSEPRMPDFPGEFQGTQVHAHHYRTADPFEDKRVLVVGIGNSAVDIAVDLVRRARSVHLSTRRSAWVMPKYIMGVPTDRWSAFIGRTLRLPTPAVRAIMSRLIFLAVGDQRRFGLPRPAHPMWREHATVSQELLPYLGHGWIRIKPDVRVLQGDRIAFADGSSDPYDAVIYATGYRTRFPFLAPEVFEVRDGQCALYRRIVAPHCPGLYFVGLVQPIGPTLPLLEHQARWIAAHLAGRLRLPDAAAMDDEIAAHRAWLRRTFVDSARYTLEVDFRSYAGQLGNDLERGYAAR